MPLKDLSAVQDLKNQAQDNGYKVLSLASDQAITLLSDDLSTTQQIAFLQQMVAELETNLQAVQPVSHPQEETPVSNLDCQVSTEERAQLFKFLST